MWGGVACAVGGGKVRQAAAVDKSRAAGRMVKAKGSGAGRVDSEKRSRRHVRQKRYAVQQPAQRCRVSRGAGGAK